MNERSFRERVLIENLPFAASALLVLVAAFKVFAFSGFELPVAFAVLSVVDYPTVLLASLVSFLVVAAPLIILVEGPWQWLTAGNRRGATVGQVWRSSLLVAPAVILIGFTINTVMLAAYLLGSGILIATRIYSQRKKRQSPETAADHLRPIPFWRNWFVITFISATVLVPSISKPWLPMEVISGPGGQKITQGYVVGEQAERLLVRTDDLRIQWIAVADIDDRTICYPEKSWTTKQLVEYLRSPEPKC
ncbi:hypothetical protein JTF08_03275 [Micrococcaceae bacterium RIT802]|nr:hypothetical protein [Micrococcaceae bacterium RIT 802]